MVSVLLLTIDRLELTKMCVDYALAHAGVPFELMVVDNGSTQPGMSEYLHSLNPSYLRLNTSNEGIAQMYNQMLIRSKNDSFCIIDPDIMLPEGWLARLVEFADAIPDGGLSGIYCVESLSPMRVVNGKQIHPGFVFGTKFFRRNMLDSIGYFCEEFYPYGLEDGDLNFRCEMYGLLSYYIGGYVSQHLGSDAGHDTAYRRMKNESLATNGPTYGRRVDAIRRPVNMPLDVYRASKVYYTAPPELR